MAKKAKQPTREELENLAREMNEVMGLEPPIKISKKLDDEGLIEKIKGEGEGNIYASDFEEDPEDDEKVVFSDEAAATLKALGIEVAEDEEAEESVSDDEEETEEIEEEEEKPAKKGAKGKKEEPKKASKGKKVEEPEEEEPEDEEEEEEDPKPKKGAKGKKEEPKPAKGKGKKVVEEEPEEEEEEEEEEKPAKKAAKGTKEAPKAKGKGKAKAEPKKGKKIKYSRSQALVDALKSFKKGATKKEIVEKSDELYVAQGGDSGMVVSEAMFRYVVPTLLLLEHIELNDGKYKLV